MKPMAGRKFGCVVLGMAAVSSSIFGQTVRFVWQESLEPAPPFATWGNAAQTIQEAIDAADHGDVIVVTNGVYDRGGKAVPSLGATLNRVAIDKAVTVKSVNGPLRTIIKGEKASETIHGPAAVRCVYMTNGAVLAGFTLTNGATASTMPHVHGGGAWCEGTDCIISNCFIAGNAAYHRGGGVCGGTLQNCVLWANSASYGGGAHDSELYFCMLRANSAEKFGGGARNSMLYDCKLYGNSAERGGGANNCTLYQCTVWGNSAERGGGVYGGRALHSTIKNNTASIEGGGAYLSYLENCTVQSNMPEAGKSLQLPKKP